MYDGFTAAMMEPSDDESDDDGGGGGEAHSGDEDEIANAKKRCELFISDINFENLTASSNMYIWSNPNSFMNLFGISFREHTLLTSTQA